MPSIATDAIKYLDYEPDPTFGLPSDSHFRQCSNAKFMESGCGESGDHAYRVHLDGRLWRPHKAFRRSADRFVFEGAALDDGTGRPSVLVTSDLVGLRRQVADGIAERCEKEYGLTRERLVINSSHTHSGPTIGEFAIRAGYEGQTEVVRRYTAALIEKAVETVGTALRNMSPARLEFSQGFAGIAVNRRRDHPGTRGLPAPVDHDVPVLAIRNPDGSLRAVVFGYACHNTTLGAYKINADYAGYAQEALEKIYPGARRYSYWAVRVMPILCRAIKARMTR
jgi:hypothetical protein